MKKRIIFRLSNTIYNQATQAVKNGKAETVSELIREALEEFLKE